MFIVDILQPFQTSKIELFAKRVSVYVALVFPLLTLSKRFSTKETQENFFVYFICTCYQKNALQEFTLNFY